MTLNTAELLGGQWPRQEGVSIIIALCEQLSSGVVSGSSLASYTGLSVVYLAVSSC